MNRFWVPFGLTFAVLCLGAGRASAQQGKYVAEAANRLTKLIDTGNKAGYVLSENTFSIGGGWLKQSKKDWIPLFTVQLVAGKPYRFLAAGDGDATDVDLEILDPSGNVVAQDAEKDPTATVDFTPRMGGKYTVRVRLYASNANNDPCLCMAVMMTKR